MIDNENLEKKLEMINKFSRRPLKEDEVYIFPVVLCDNEVDRDNERFSDEALKKLSELFVGKTGIFDHNPKGMNQTARIFSVEIKVDREKLTSYGKPYMSLNAEAYMVKTASNSDLIKEIDGGIKKEVSVGCSVKSKICSICGKDLNISPCSHIKGKNYKGKKCYTILSEPTDAYEWSFVAVPAQINAGVTKRFSENGFDSVEKVRRIEKELGEKTELLNKFVDDMKEEILKLSYFADSLIPVEVIKSVTDKMTTEELIEFRKSLKNQTDKSFSPELLSVEKSLESKINVEKFKI